MSGLPVFPALAAPMVCESIILNVNIILTEMDPSRAFSWPIQYTTRMFGLRTFPSLVVPKGSETNVFFSQNVNIFLTSHTDKCFVHYVLTHK